LFGGLSQQEARMGKAERTRAQVFLDEHLALREAMQSSAAFAQVKAEARLVPLPTGEAYLVYGDTLGGEEDLYLDRLARGANESSADTLSRKLFLELSPEAQEVVRNELLRGPGEFPSF